VKNEILKAPYASSEHTTIENYAPEAGLKFQHFIERLKLIEVHKTFCDMHKSGHIDFAFQLFRNTQDAWTFSLKKINSYIQCYCDLGRNCKEWHYFFQEGKCQNQESYKNILEKCLCLIS